MDFKLKEISEEKVHIRLAAILSLVTTGAVCQGKPNDLYSRGPDGKMHAVNALP